MVIVVLVVESGGDVFVRAQNNLLVSGTGGRVRVAIADIGNASRPRDEVAFRGLLFQSNLASFGEIVGARGAILSRFLASENLSAVAGIIRSRTVGNYGNFPRSVNKFVGSRLANSMLI